MFGKTIFGKKMFGKTIFGKKMFGKTIFGKKMFGKTICGKKIKKDGLNVSSSRSIRRREQVSDGGVVPVTHSPPNTKGCSRQYCKIYLSKIVKCICL